MIDALLNSYTDINCHEMFNILCNLPACVLVYIMKLPVCQFILWNWTFPIVKKYIDS